MKWKKIGLIFRPSGQGGWMNSHAQIPTVLVTPKHLRVYFASRPRAGVSLTTFIDLDIDDPRKILALHNEPILSLGRPGFFDEHGIMPSFACYHGEQVRLYYGGWSRRVGVPYSNWTGLATSDDGGQTFVREFEGPVLDRTPHEVFSATALFCNLTDALWHGWYSSGESWVDVNGKLEELYHVRHATSTDGVTWQRNGRRVLGGRRLQEAVHRPTVFLHQGTWHMLFCHRGLQNFRDGTDSYRIGYARSDDLQNWVRSDEEAGLKISEDGWDSRMLAYPYIVTTQGKTLLFYNGNGFGESGFGCAELIN